jgi:hypothetical protein
MDIIIGKPLVSPDVLSLDDPIYTQERYLPKLLIELGIFTSISQVRKNRPDLCITLDTIDCREFKIGKRRLYIVIGEEEPQK